MYVYDLFDPANPLSVAYLPESNVHDVFARNDTLWVANSIDYSIWNMSDPGNPALIARLQDTAFGYCHNIWPTKDGRHFVTTEETGNKTVKIWSLSPTGDVALVSEFLGPNKLVHNAHVEGDFLFLAHYSSGVIVVDISDPANPVPVAEYDSYPLNDTTAFYGCWGVYPHSNSGFIYASNFEGKVQKFRFRNTTDIHTESKNIPVLVFPNPGSQPSIGFALATEAEVKLAWLDQNGRVLSLQRQHLAAGQHRVHTDAGSWPAGTYYFKLSTPSGDASGIWVKH